MESSIARLLLLPLLFFSACTGAFVKTGAPSPDLERLLASNNKKISLIINSPESSQSFGSQYLFIALPLTRIEIENPAQEVQQAFTQALAVAGYQVSQETGISTLHITLSELQLEGYDYLFFRRPWCEAIMQARLISPGGQLLGYVSTSQSSAEYTKFAFEPELSRVLRKTLELSATEAVTKLHL